MKNIKLEDRLIFALDVPEFSEAKALVDELDAVSYTHLTLPTIA